MYRHFFKRAIDFTISLLCLILLSPVLLVVTILLYFANGKSGVFFCQERPGRNAKLFKIVKFKTMTDGRDANGELLSDSERLTKVGRFVRSTSIDELPQLINVVKGDMALIGPRPLLVRYLPYYTEREMVRHSVRPGITGWAQVHGRNLLSWDKRFELDVWYVEHLSWRVDLEVLWLTVLKIVKKEDLAVDAGTVSFEDLNIERASKDETAH